jgi:hypothetical protein
MLTITYSNDQTMILTRDKAQDLELKLNVSSKGRLWKSLGFSLFEFHSTGISNGINVTEEQFNFLELLKTKKGWESCKGLA